MEDARKKDRRKKNKKNLPDRRMGPRRLVCGCGGKVEAVIANSGSESFVCLRCGKKL